MAKITIDYSVSQLSAEDCEVGKIYSLHGRPVMFLSCEDVGRDLAVDLSGRFGAYLDTGEIEGFGLRYPRFVLVGAVRGEK